MAHVGKIKVRVEIVGKEDRGPTLICALRAGRPEHTPEAEPVLIETVGEAGAPQTRRKGAVRLIAGRSTGRRAEPAPLLPQIQLLRRTTGDGRQA